MRVLSTLVCCLVACGGGGSKIDNPLGDPADGVPAGNPNGTASIPGEAGLADISQPRSVIGAGTPQSCTSAAVVDAVAKGGVIVPGRNFGNNSSREQAVHVLRLMGVAGIVASSFGRQFYRNCINNGLPVAEADLGVKDGDEIEIDLALGRVAVPARGIDQNAGFAELLSNRVPGRDDRPPFHRIGGEELRPASRGFDRTDPLFTPPLAAADDRHVCARRGKCVRHRTAQ